ncbi:hypothetical protein JHK85_037862 [Glycine max]|nr:hypothetical protein JHK85_037862 [Glycine max]
MSSRGEAVTLPDVNIDDIHNDTKKLLAWNNNLLNYWEAFPYFLEAKTSKKRQSMHIAKFSDRKKNDFTRDSLEQGKEENDENEKKDGEDGDEDENAQEEDEEDINDDDYNQNIDFDDDEDEDDYNDVDDGDGIVTLLFQCSSHFTFTSIILIQIQQL